MRAVRVGVAVVAVAAACAGVATASNGEVGTWSASQDVAASTTPVRNVPTSTPLSDMPSTPTPTPAPPVEKQLGGKRDARTLLDGAMAALRSAKTGRVVSTTGMMTGGAGYSRTYDTIYDLGENEWSSVMTIRQFGMGETGQNQFTFDMVGANGRTHLHARSKAWKGKPWLAYRWSDVGARTADIESMLMPLREASPTGVVERNGERVVTATLPAYWAISLLHFDAQLIKKYPELKPVTGKVGIELVLDGDGAPVRLILDSVSLKSNLPKDAAAAVRISTFESGFSGLGEPVDVKVPTNIKLVPSDVAAKIFDGGSWT